MRAGSFAKRLGFNIACLPRSSLEEACRLGQQLGFAGVELAAFTDYRHSQGEIAGFYFERLSAAERRRLRALVQPFAYVSLHGPFHDLPLLSPHPALRETAQRQLEIALEATAYLGGTILVTHAAGKPTYTLTEGWEELVRLYRQLGEAAAALGVKITIETGYPPGVEDFARLLREIDHPAVGATVDVGHLVSQLPTEMRRRPDAAAYYNDLLEAHLRSLGSKLFHLHLHDVRASDWRDHRACGRGVIDFARLLRVAEELGYTGLYVFELEEADCVAALEESRACLLAQAEQ